MGYHQFEPLLVLSAMCLAGTQLSKQRGDVRTSAGPNLWGGASEMPPVRRVDRSGSGGVWCKYLGGPNGLGSGDMDLEPPLPGTPPLFDEIGRFGGAPQAEIFGYLGHY